MELVKEITEKKTIVVERSCPALQIHPLRPLHIKGRVDLFH